MSWWSAAGAQAPPAAMLLARAGLSVRLLERSARLVDVASGHLIKPAGVARLRRWNLLDAVLATGCPALHDRVLWLGGQPHRPSARQPGPGPIAPRRTALDPILLAAATQAGVKVEMGVSVRGLLRQGGRVTGVTTSAGQGRARLVIGADGRNSRIAQLIGARIYHDHPPVTFAYYIYWHSCPVTGMHAWLEPGRFFGTFPVGDGLALAFVQAPRSQYPAFRRDPLTAYLSEWRSRPALADLLGEGLIAERLRGTAALPTFFRTSSGPGRSSPLGGARSGRSGGSCQRSPPRAVITAVVARQGKQPLAGCSASGDAGGQGFAAGRRAMALRDRLRGDAEAGRPQKCRRGEHGAVNRPDATNVVSS
jgi:flavin-dependent dehydrogenase